MDKEIVYLNGTILPAEQAHIGVGDVGLLHGGSVFSTLAAFGGRPLRLDRHLQRLFGSASALGIRTDATPEALAKTVLHVMDANELSAPGSRARIRITLTPGNVQGGQPTTLVTAVPLPQYPAEMYDRGIGVVVASFRQSTGDPTYGHKTGCYFPRILARQEAHAKGCQEALWFTPDNRLAEGCFTNVFLVKAGEVLTPPLTTPVLPGVTRQAVLEICAAEEITARDDQALTVQDMLAADEIFLTASTMGVVPVVRVERHAVGNERIGPITQRIMHAYNELVERETGNR